MVFAWVGHVVTRWPRGRLCDVVTLDNAGLFDKVE
jgi:hypothetical protein